MRKKLSFPRPCEAHAKGYRRESTAYRRGKKSEINYVHLLTSVVCRSNTQNIKFATIPEQSTNLAIRANMRGERGFQPRVMPFARKMSIISPVSLWQTYIHRFVIGQ